MRALVFIISVFSWLLVAAGPAYAVELAAFPGWKLERMEKEQSAEDAASGVAFEYGDYFALYPNDARPPITVDGGTATRLLKGQLNPETVYSGRGEGAVDLAKKQAEQAGGNGAVGWQVAESTYVPLGEGKSGNSGGQAFGDGAIRAPASGGGAASGGSGAWGIYGGRNGAEAPAAAAASVTQANANRGGSNSAFASGAFKPATGGLGGTVVNNPISTNVDTSNMTYSQMIDAAMGNASTSLCGRMGGYAPAGSCGK